MHRASTASTRGSKRLRLVTGIALALGVVALVFTVWKVGPGALVDHLRAIGPWFGVLLAIEASATLCDAGGLYWMTRGPGAPSLRAVCVAQFAGRGVNSVTPGGNVGEALKVSLLARACSSHRIVAAVVYLATMALVLSLTLIALGTLVTAVLFASTLPVAAELALVTAGVLAAAAAAALVLALRRGLLGILSRVGRRLRLISPAREDRWADRIVDLDARLRGDVQEDHRFGAVCLIMLSQLLTRVGVGVAIAAAGYSLGGPQLIAVLSAGVVLGWVSAIVPLGVGVSEGGNSAIFALIGAPASLGVALALARRVNQIVFAMLGFAVLAIDRLATTDPLLPPLPIATNTSRHAVIS